LEKDLAHEFLVTDIYKLAFASQKTSRLYYNGVLFKEIVVVYAGHSTKPVCTVWAKCRVLSVKVGGKYGYHCFEGLSY
jgi:hypothetical protein